MVNQQVLQGRWNEIRGKLQEKWGQLSEDELKTVEGSANQLVGLIQRKTGESREAIENFLDEVTRDGGYAERAGEAVREYAQQATEQFRGASEHLTESVRDRYASAETMVRQRPVESVAVAFAAGLIAGVVVGLTVRR